MQYFKDAETSIKYSIVFISIVAAGILISVYFNYKITNQGVISKAVVLNIFVSGKNSRRVQYVFIYKGQKKETTDFTKLNTDAIGKQFFVKILSEGRGMQQLLEEQPVPECLKNTNPPSDGWSDFPQCP
jgi:hypothetical protein